jgi:uncharacterized protein YycO
VTSTKRPRSNFGSHSKPGKDKRTKHTIFALRPGQIRIGDIILTAGSGLASQAIRRATKSDFSHASLCTQPGKLIEALDTGVQWRTVFATYATRQEWIRVLRPKKELLPNSCGLTIADCAESIYGREYSLQGAIASRFPFMGSTRGGGVFCSQVIAEAYRLYGMPLLRDKTPSQIYPGLLLNSPELSDVTEKCVRKLNSLSNSDVFKLVVETANQESLSDEMGMVRQVFEAIRKELRDNLPECVYSWSDLISWLSMEFRSDAVKKSDPAILKILETEGMFKWQDRLRMNTLRHIEIIEWAATGFEASAHYPMTAETESLLRDFADTEELRQSSLQRRRGTSEEYRQLAKMTGLKVFERLSEVYLQEYQDAQRLHGAIDRMLAAVKRRTPSSP